MAQAVELRVIGMIGTGDVGLALTRGFLRDGYKVIMGTRKPDEGKTKEIVEKLKTKGINKEEMVAVEKHIGHFSLATQEKSSKRR